MSKSEEIGRRLKLFRISLGLKGFELAKALGVVPSYVSGMEKGKKVRSRNMLFSLKEQFFLNIDWLLDGEGPMILEKKES